MIDKGPQQKLPGEGGVSLMIVLDPPLKQHFSLSELSWRFNAHRIAQHLLRLTNGALSVEEVYKGMEQ